VHIVVGEFGEREQIKPIVLLMINEDVEARFQSLVHAFRLSVSLRMEGTGFARVDFENGRKRRPEVGRKDRTMIGDNGIGKSMQSDDVGDKEAREVGHGGTL